MLIVNRISGLMDRRGWGPGELATYSGASYDVIYKLLNTDRPRPSADIIAKIASALGCSMEYLLNMTDNPAPVTGTEDRVSAIILDPEERRIVQMILDDIAAMSNADKRYAADLIRRITPQPPRIIGSE